MFCHDRFSGLHTGTKEQPYKGNPFHSGIRFALEVDARDDSGGDGGGGDDDGGVGRHTVSFFIDGEQQPYSVLNVPKSVYFGVCCIYYLLLILLLLFPFYTIRLMVVIDMSMRLFH
jgi:hypothetical protein